MRFFLFVVIPTCLSLSLVASKEVPSPKSVVPVKRQQSFLHFLTQLLDEFGSLLEPHLSDVFSILLHQCSSCTKLLSEMRHQVCHVTYIYLYSSVVIGVKGCHGVAV